ncbi:Carbonic anhydrase 7-like protein, partial [Leptotrombidium deliense]
EAVFRRERSEYIDPKSGKYKLIGSNYRSLSALNGRTVVVADLLIELAESSKQTKKKVVKIRPLSKEVARKRAILTKERKTTFYKGQFYGGHDWVYKKKGDIPGEDEWPDSWPDCGGERQSPINIISRNVVRDPNLNLQFDGYYKALNKPFVQNNGHTVAVASSIGAQPLISGSALGDETYQFDSLHFHWGTTRNLGAEHRLDGKSSALELHLVHFNVKYGSLAAAINESDGLAVLGVFYRAVSS